MEALEAVFATGTQAHWLATLEQAGLVAGPINTLAEAFADPQAQARDLVRHVRHSSGGTAPLVASPMRLSSTPLDTYAAPPTSGQHTEEVLGELLGMSSEQIARLTSQETP